MRFRFHAPFYLFYAIMCFPGGKKFRFPDFTWAVVWHSLPLITARRQMERFCLCALRTENRTRSLADASSLKQSVFYFTMFRKHGEIPLRLRHPSSSAAARFNVACREPLAFRPLDAEQQMVSTASGVK